MKAYEQQFSQRPGDGQAERLVIVGDHSGSMKEADFHPSRLDGFKQAGEALLAIKAEHAPADEAAIIGYGSDACVEQSFTLVGKGLGQLRRAVRRISISGSTNITAGLKTAANLLNQSHTTSNNTVSVAAWLKSMEHLLFESSSTPSQDSVFIPSPRILLCTDGHHNNGPSPRGIARELKAQGVVIQAIGIGGTPEDVDEKLLKSIVSPDAQGEPQYLFIGAEEGTSKLIQAFQQRASYPKLL